MAAPANEGKGETMFQFTRRGQGIQSSTLFRILREADNKRQERDLLVATLEARHWPFESRDWPFKRSLSRQRVAKRKPQTGRV